MKMEQSAIPAAMPAYTQIYEKRKKISCDEGRRQRKATQPTEPNQEQKRKFSFVHTKIKKEV